MASFFLCFCDALNKGKDSENIRKISDLAQLAEARQSALCFKEEREERRYMYPDLVHIYIGINTKCGTNAAASHWLSDTASKVYEIYILNYDETSDLL